MNFKSRGILTFALAAATFAPTAAFAQNTATASSKDQWIHVRVESKDDKGQSVRVNVPVEMAEKVLPAINKNNLRDGKIRINSADMEDIDLRAMLDAIRTAKDGEYVTVQSKENDVRVAKSNGYLLIHVTDNKGNKTKSDSARESKVEVKVPMKVVDALFSAGKDELDVLAALKVLSSYGDTELVSVKDDQNTVRVWIDSKNIAN